MTTSSGSEDGSESSNAGDNFFTRFARTLKRRKRENRTAWRGALDEIYSGPVGSVLSGKIANGVRGSFRHVFASESASPALGVVTTQSTHSPASASASASDGCAKAPRKQTRLGKSSKRQRQSSNSSSGKPRSALLEAIDNPLRYFTSSFEEPSRELTHKKQRVPQKESRKNKLRKRWRRKTRRRRERGRESRSSSSSSSSSSAEESACTRKREDRRRRKIMHTITQRRRGRYIGCIQRCCGDCCWFARCCDCCECCINYRCCERVCCCDSQRAGKAIRVLCGTMCGVCSLYYVSHSAYLIIARILFGAPLTRSL